MFFSFMNVFVFSLLTFQDTKTYLKHLRKRKGNQKNVGRFFGYSKKRKKKIHLVVKAQCWSKNEQTEYIYIIYIYNIYI